MAELSARPYFEPVGIISERVQNIDYAIELAISKLGICIVLVTPVVDVTNPEVSGPFFDKCLYVARVLQQVTLDPSGLDALDVAINVAMTLHGFKPASLNGPLTVQSPAVTLGNDPRYLSYDVRLMGGGGGSYVPPKLDLEIANAAGEITLSSTTPGAAIFYRTDGKNPSTQAALYSGPFTPPAGTTVKARAWLAGFRASELVSATT